MGLLYSTVERGNPGNPDAPKKFYLQSKIRGKKSHKQILADAARNNALNVKEVDTGVYAYFQSVFAALSDGFSVEVEGLGTLSTSIKSEGVATVAEATASKVKNISLTFRPKPEVSDMVKRFKIEKYVPNSTLK
jgi:nucleoid DNA-binding protein